jgi:hypothetical protein
VATEGCEEVDGDVRPALLLGWTLDRGLLLELHGYVRCNLDSCRSSWREREGGKVVGGSLDQCVPIMAGSLDLQIMSDGERVLKLRKRSCLCFISHESLGL